MSEEDICSSNLQTATLFKSLTIKFRELNSQSVIIQAHQDLLTESMEKISDVMSTIDNLCLIYDIHTNDTSSVYTSMKELRKTIQDKITDKESILELSIQSVSLKLNDIRALISSGIQDMVKPDICTKKLCPICFDREVGVALIPCGHTYCVGCADYDKYIKCPQCRAIVTSNVKLFFST
jgi:hypothetical protein